MEERIGQIIAKNEYWTGGGDISAKEITALIESEYVEKEFVEWLTKNSMRATDGDFHIGPLRLGEIAKYYTIDEARKYWLKEVKQK